MKKNIIMLCIIMLSAAGLLSAYFLNESKQEKGKKVTNINILISLNGDNGNKVIYERYMDAFNTISPSVQAKAFYVPSDVEAILKLIYAKQANQIYDIACLGANQIHTLCEQDFIVPLDSYISESFGMYWLEQLLPVTMANGTAEGEIWSVPYLRNARVVLFNRSRINSTKSHMTLNELFALTKAQGNENNQPFLLAPLKKLLLEYIAYQSPYVNAAAYERGTYINIINGDKTEVIENAQTNIAAKRIKDYSENETKGMESFLNGKCSALVTNTAYVDKISSIVNFPIAGSVLMMDQDNTFPLQAVNLYLVKQPGVEDYTAQWEALQSLWRIATEKQELLYKDHLPITEMQRESSRERFVIEKNEFWKLLSEDYNGYSSMAYSQNAKISLLMETMLNKLLNQEDEPQKALPELQQHLKSILESKE